MRTDQTQRSFFTLTL